MSSYKSEADQRKTEKQRHFFEMFSFGDRMRLAMGLKMDDLGDSDMSWDIQGFSLHVRSFPQNSWIPTIIAVPTGIDGNRVGYANTSESVPSGWHYVPSGTGTVFYPPKAIQDIILAII